jgi:hypothetical protein
MVDSAGRGRSIHLFARPADSPEFLYVLQFDSGSSLFATTVINRAAAE